MSAGGMRWKKRWRPSRRTRLGASPPHPDVDYAWVAVSYFQNFQSFKQDHIWCTFRLLASPLLRRMFLQAPYTLIAPFSATFFTSSTSELRLWAINMGLFFHVLYFLQLPSGIYYPQLNLKCLCKWSPDSLDGAIQHTFVYIMLDPSLIFNSSGASITVIGSNISCQWFFSPFPHTTESRLYFDCIDGSLRITLNDRQPRLWRQFKQHRNMQLWYDWLHRSNENLLLLATIHSWSDDQWILRCTSGSCKVHRGILTILVF
jgi:hypothetical protein